MSHGGVVFTCPRKDQADAQAMTSLFRGHAPDTPRVPDEALPGDFLADRKALELVRVYCAILENQRRRLFGLARVMPSALA